LQTNENEGEIIEVDDEVLNHFPDGVQELLVIYDIAHSPSYQVPVLYITFKPYRSNDTALSTLPNLDEVYELLSPPSLQAQMREVGVMGALSMIDHPVSGALAYFVHPCRTAEGMEAVIGHGPVSPVRYLLLWIGLVGQGIGLDVPTELAEAMSEAV
jgi:ubiquitin-like-conjugating enzyme ATG10